MARACLTWLLLAAVIGLAAVPAWGCRSERRAPPKRAAKPAAPQAALPDPVQAVAPPPVPMLDPVPLWQHGRTERLVDAATAGRNGYLVIDLGELWTPYLFSDGVSSDGAPLLNTYRPTYLALARGDFPDDQHGERARVDKYLELYGILPTLTLLRERMRATFRLPCVDGLDRSALEQFTRIVTYSNMPDAQKRAARYSAATARVRALLQLQAAAAPDALDTSALSKKDRATLAFYLDETPVQQALLALQQRLRCEGYLAGRGKVLPGVMDWATHEALAEFERRNRVFSLGYLSKDSLAPLRQTPKDVEREAVLRVLLERAIHAAGVLEDGSALGPDGQPATYLASDGQRYFVPNLAQELREVLVEAFGLRSPEFTLAWLEGLGKLADLPPTEHRRVAVPMVPLPEYYAPDMALTLDYDRGDIWYDFPYDDQGQPVPQPVARRPQVTVSTHYKGQKIPLARFGTTIGGFRTELVNGTVMWKYKESPVGPRAWDEIVSAPVWMPPDGTPPEELLKRNTARKDAADPEYVVNYHEVGPSYASAYGLVAAYHRTYAQRADGSIALGHDEGIRTHGSVDYMSIMRRHSHGCHRLHNHIALRLMSFVLAHRPHQRLGHEPLSFRRYLLLKDKAYLMDLKQGGYVFKLATPLLVNVEEGRIRGVVKAPIAFAIPRYDSERRGSFMPDGRKVVVRGNQLLPAPSAPPSPVARNRPRDRAAGSVLPPS